MARRPFKIAGASLAGGLALSLVLTLSFGSLAAVLSRSDCLSGLTPSDWAAARFTLMQASLSSLLSVVCAIPLARALARRKFYGRRLAIAALGAPFILPVISAVMGLIALFGRTGFINAGLANLGLPPLSIYGLTGILLAHLFLNVPLAVRMLLNGWAAIPSERFRLAATLGFAARDTFRLIEVPMLRATLPGIFLVIFLVCLTSFTVVLVLGGGPAATTLELTIYQAFRLEFDLGHAASLAILQFAVSCVAALCGLALAKPPQFGAGLMRPVDRWDVNSGVPRFVDGTLLIMAAAFLLAPLCEIFFGGAPNLFDLGGSVWWAAVRSLLVAAGATLLAICLSLSIGLLIVDLPTGRAKLADMFAMLSLVASPLVLGTGVFLLTRHFADPVTIALPVTALVNAATAMPFCLRVLRPDLAAIRADYGRLAESLNITGVTLLRMVVLPRLRRPLCFAAGLAAALSIGDLGVVTLFSDPAQATLPMQVYALASAYKTDQAAGASLLLIALAFASFRLLDQWGHHDVDA